MKDFGPPKFLDWLRHWQCFHKFEKSVISANVTNVPECQTSLMQASFHAV